jgi:amidase
VTIASALDVHDGLGLAALVRSGEVTASELLEEAIRRAERVNPRLNAVITTMYDEARRSLELGVPEGPFAGVPFLLKDILQPYAGVRHTRGSKALRNYVPSHDSEVVSRFKRAGFVSFGRTNVPEFGLVAVTEPEAFGPCRNPWDVGRTPGGSSGGAAAVVAAGVVPIAGATDGGGSIRIPAGWCGIFGLKPSRGRVPSGPDNGEVWDGAVVEHVLTRTVRDSAAVLDALTGPAAGDPFLTAPPERPFLDEIALPPRTLRIGFTSRSPMGNPVDPECRTAVEETARLLEDLGHVVVPAQPRVDGVAVARAYLTLYYGQVAADVRWVERMVGKSAAARELEPETRVIAAIGENLSSADYLEARRGWNDFARAMGEFHRDHDLFLTPTASELPLPIGTLRRPPFERGALRVVNRLRAGAAGGKTGIIEKLAFRNLEPVPFTQLANLTGQPAMSVPLHWSAGGLPCGSHFVAPIGGEAMLLRLAAQLEEARPWGGRVPMVHASRSD